MRISYINAICVKNDAVSNSIRDEIIWLSSEGLHEIRLYAYSCEYEDLLFTQVSDLKDVVFDQHFQLSDLVVFHFGVFYPLFNLLPVVPLRAKRLVVFHNITPKQFVRVENHSIIDKSFQQMSNIAFADHVVCVSQTNLDVLQSSGIRTPSTVLPLAVHSNLQMPESKPSVVDGLIRIAFIGRFVRSKGPSELIEALHKVLQRNESVHLILDMIGNLSFSDSGLLEEIRNTAEEIHRAYGDRVKINIHGNATEAMKCQVLHDADLFILPTYHEGFCVPILEALACGCKVIAYENSNTPAISGGLAKLTPTGDIESLSCAIARTVEEIASSAWQENYAEYMPRAQQYVEQYSPECAKRRFLNFIKSIISSTL